MRRTFQSGLVEVACAFFQRAQIFLYEAGGSGRPATSEGGLSALELPDGGDSTAASGSPLVRHLMSQTSEAYPRRARVRDGSRYLMPM